MGDETPTTSFTISTPSSLPDSDGANPLSEAPSGWKIGPANIIGLPPKFHLGFGLSMPSIDGSVPDADGCGEVARGGDGVLSRICCSRGASDFSNGAKADLTGLEKNERKVGCGLGDTASRCCLALGASVLLKLRPMFTTIIKDE